MHAQTDRTPGRQILLPSSISCLRFAALRFVYNSDRMTASQQHDSSRFCQRHDTVQSLASVGHRAELWWACLLMRYPLISFRILQNHVGISGQLRVRLHAGEDSTLTLDY